ncbi:MAG: cyclic nucleotide-binding domain-containing protein [Oscillospiraceae bacterium]|nr:cyclic nucleotide-binding domain-containing protein [Oscillospiraceae bacterium]
MPLLEFKQGSAICGEGEPLRRLLFVIKGSAEASLGGRPFRFENGDMIGLCGLGADSHCLTYTALSDTTVFAYPYAGLGDLEALLRDNADVAYLLVNSMCRQISAFLKYRAVLKREADGAYRSVMEIYPQYERLCALYALTPKKLPGLSAIAPFSEPDPLEDWAHDYYTEIRALEPAVHRAFFYGKPGISSGFLRKSAEDILDTLQGCRLYQEYLGGIAKVILSGGGHDLFSLISELHFDSLGIKGADAAVETLMMQLTGLSHITGIDAAGFHARLHSYKDELMIKRASQEITNVPAAAGGGGVKQNLSDSLDIILSYSGCPEETCNKFIRLVQEYTGLPERGGSDTAARRVRKELTAMFYTIYQQVFLKSLADRAPSTVIKMFLNFGYVDAALAGPENADFLYSIADSVKGDPEQGFYTLREWLTAIHEGKKEPSRNEFDLDYPAYLHEMKTSGKIDAKEETRLLADLGEKLRFEIENVVPIVNKITFGQISIFCPLFADHNVHRKPEGSLVTPALLKKAFDEIRAVDFSAYFREKPYSNLKCGVPNEFVHVEVLPEIILMPNAGVRGAMWQEIDGRKRTTPARMFMSLFLEGDLKNLLIRLTGEFRWEMCKRVQGMRWNDVTNPSLTSEYCDYLQFYRNNRDFPIEVKDAIREELVRAKNNFKTVFISNYSEWLLYEANGSLRLNKNVRRLLTTYCPFSAAIREKLMQNPLFAEVLNRYNFKTQQRIQYLSNVMQKINRTTSESPPELLDEIEYAAR